jgi:hypothetical protein
VRTSKYDPLREWLTRAPHPAEVSFGQPSQDVGGLPPSAYRRREWWANDTNGHVQARADGTPIPTLYAATTVAGALSESVFHDVPYRGRGKRILAARLNGLALSTLIVTEPIRLALVAGLGLRRLGVRRRDLIEGGPGSCAQTAAWALALYNCPVAPSGLLWVSRQDDTANALLLFGDRVPAGSLHIASDPVPLDVGPGLALVDDAATLARITVVR